MKIVPLTHFHYNLIKLSESTLNNEPDLKRKHVMNVKAILGLILTCVFASACCTERELMEEKIEKKERVIKRELIIE